MTTDDTIRLAHAEELSGELTRWVNMQLYEFPADRVNTEQPEQNVVMRVTYATDEAKSEIDKAADFPMPLPLNSDTFRLASAVSLHSEVFGVALYGVHADGSMDLTPAVAYADGNEFSI